jgi:hypothetical protein
MSVATLGMVETFDRVYASAPTHVAVDNFAARIHEIDMRAVKSYNLAHHSEPRHRRRKLVIRAYKIQEEMAAFRKLLKNPRLGDDACPNDSRRGTPRWKLHLSLSYWLLMAMGSSAVRPLDEDEDPAILVQFSQDLGVAVSYGKLDEFVARTGVFEHKDSDDESGASSLCSSAPSCDGIMTPATTATSETGDKTEQPAAGEISHPQRIKEAMRELIDDDDHGGDRFEQLLRCLIRRADVLCSTPSLSTKPLFKEWRSSQARAVAVDEAANMSRPDLYTIWGNTLLPCMLGGDDEQLQPVVTSEREQRPQGTFLNRHVADGKMSPLKFLKARGWPVFRLHYQFRMARGLFDLCHAQIYPDLPFQYAPGCDITREGHSDGVRLEGYLQSKYPALRAPSVDKLLPVFFHCMGTRTLTDQMTKSRLNREQIKLALDFLLDLVRDLGINPADMGLITPYKACVRHIKRLRKKGKYAPLKKMSPATTVDGFQGQERDIMVVVMGTTEASGPGFTADKYRLNVMFSRQKNGLVVFGDTGAAKNGGRGITHEDIDDQNHKVLEGMYSYFESHGRVVRVAARPGL